MGGAVNAELYAFMKIINGETFSVDEMKGINAIVQLPPLFIRERAMQVDRFARMTDVLKLLEYAQEGTAQRIPKNYQKWL